jgi:hypothetical protein
MKASVLEVLTEEHVVDEGILIDEFRITGLGLVKVPLKSACSKLQDILDPALLQTVMSSDG